MKKRLLLAFLALTTLTAHAQHFDWVKTYSGPDRQDQTPANEIVGSVMDREGNLYILGQFIPGASIDGMHLLPITGNRNLSTFIAKFSPSGDMLWHKTVYSSYAGAYGIAIRLLDDSAIMVYTNFFLPFVRSTDDRNEVYFLDTLLTTNGYFLENANNIPIPYYANAFLTMSLDSGHLMEKHIVSQAYVKTDNTLLTDELTGDIVSRGGYNTFNLDKEGNIILIRRTDDVTTQTCSTCPDGYYTWSPSDSNIQSIRLLIDGARHLDVPLEPSSTWNYQILKIAPHFDSVIASTYVFDSTWLYGPDYLITTYVNSIDMNTGNDIYITFSRRHSLDTLPVKNSDTLAMVWNSCMIRYSPDLIPTGMAQVTASLDPNGGSAGGLQILSTLYDSASNSLFLQGYSGRDSRYTTLNYKGDTLNLMNNACWLRLDADNLNLISYGKARSFGTRSYDRTFLSHNILAYNGSIAADGNRVFCQVKYQISILFHDTSYSNPYGMGLFIWDYDGHEIAYLDYNSNHVDNRQGYIHLKDSSVWVDGTICADADFGNNHISSTYHSSAFIAKYVDTSFMTPYVYTDPRVGQAIEWEQDLSFFLSDSPVVLTATATCGLPVSYLCSDTAVARVSGSTLHLLSDGVATITACQNGNEYGYYPATPVTKTLTVSIDTTINDTTIVDTTINDTTGISPVYGSHISVYPNPTTGRVTIDMDHLPSSRTPARDSSDIQVTLTDKSGAFVKYGNPFRQRVNVNCSGADPIVSATLTDMAGRREEVRLTPQGDGRYTLDLTSRPQATYLLTLTTASGQRHTVRLLKQSDIFSR